MTSFLLLRRAALASCGMRAGGAWRAGRCAGWVQSRQPCAAVQQRLMASQATGGEGRQIQPPDVPELARLAHIAVTEEEVGPWLAVAGRGERILLCAGHAHRLHPLSSVTTPGSSQVSAPPHPPPLQVKDWAPKIEGIVEWFGQLQEVDVEGVPPALRAEVESENFLRADAPREYEHRSLGSCAGALRPWVMSEFMVAR